MNLTTPAHRIWPMRTIGAEDAEATILARLDSTGDFAQMPSGAVDLLKDSIALAPEVERVSKVLPYMETNGIEIYMAGSTDADKTMDWYLTAWRNENGPAKRVAVGTAVTGTQKLVVYPHNMPAGTIANMFWCDTITVTWENWMKDVESTSTTGRNTVASLFLDACGYRYWMLEFRTTGTDAAATSLCAYYGRF